MPWPLVRTVAGSGGKTARPGRCRPWSESRRPTTGPVPPPAEHLEAVTPVEVVQARDGRQLPVKQDVPAGEEDLSAAQEERRPDVPSPCGLGHRKCLDLGQSYRTEHHQLAQLRVGHAGAPGPVDMQVDEVGRRVGHDGADHAARLLLGHQYQRRGQVCLQRVIGAGDELLGDVPVEALLGPCSGRRGAPARQPRRRPPHTGRCPE